MDKKKVWGIAFTYTGAVVGAGFSSGKEIWQFFGRHQASGIFGIFLVAIFFAGLAPILFQLGKRYDVDSYYQLIYSFLPIPLSLGLDLIHIFFLLGSVSVMLAGSGTIFRDILGLSYIIGVIITLVFILATLYLKVEGIMIVNSFLIPFLVIITILTIISYLPNPNIDLYQQILALTPGQNGWLLDSILYGSYNLVIAMTVILGVVYKEKENNIIWGSIWGGLLLFFLNLIIFIGLIAAFCTSPEEEIPMLYLARKGGRGIYLAYTIALYFAMVSTAIGNFYIFNQRLISLLKIKYEYGLLLTIILILPFIRLGFANLVEKLYPIYGYLSLFILGFYFILWFKDKLQN